MPAMKQTWSRLGGQLGMGCIGLGLLAIGIAWNGAAGIDFVQGQLPYLLSGGFLGLALVVLGAALIITQGGRRDRAMLEAQLRELNQSLGRLATAIGGPLAANGGMSAAGISAISGDAVVVGQSSFHRPGCRLIDGKTLDTTTRNAAEAEGLSPCRVCRPDELETVA
ncbi:MAG: hypothetical protein QOG03_432 [Actinomycetota bacterium]|jgi:hypothetical protein|nr:hypothetical protein [Actinomycetota bacterium]